MSTLGSVSEWHRHSHGRHNIRNQIDTLLLRPSSHEHKQIGLGILLDTGPLLCLPLELGSLRLGLSINPDVAQCHRVLVQGGNIGGV
jgi:hypothetical protein